MFELCVSILGFKPPANAYFNGFPNLQVTEGSAVVNLTLEVEVGEGHGESN